MMTPAAGGGSGYVLGVLGGMGPLASAEFMRTLYRRTTRGPEQEAPHVVMDSDPTFPDRTTSLLADGPGPILAQLTDRVARLCAFPVSEVVVCCLTAHSVLHLLPPELERRVVSMVWLALAETLARCERQLLVCTDGARRLEVFTRHPLWERARDLIVLPDDADQHALHEVIYRLKRNAPRRAEARRVDEIVARYGVDSYIAGCTEMHLLSGLRRGDGRARRTVDPLRAVARRLSRGESASAPVRTAA